MCASLEDTTMQTAVAALLWASWGIAGPSDREPLCREPPVSAGACNVASGPGSSTAAKPRAGGIVPNQQVIPMTIAKTNRAQRVSVAPALSAALAALVLVACESEITEPPEVFEEGTIAIDASSPISFAYLNLADGELVTPSDPSTDANWHMAFRRFSIRLNGGVAGSGSVSGFNLGNNSNMSAEQVTALAEQDGETVFEAVSDADIPAPTSFMEEGLAPDPGASWFRFDFRTGLLVANPGAAWKVRESSGRGYAVFRVLRLEMEGQRPVGVTVEFRRHEPNGTLGALETVAGDLRRGPVFLSFADGPAINPAGCGWDIGVIPDLSIQINADCGAGTFPLDATDGFTAIAQADDAPDYGGFLSAISGAFPVTVDDASGFFWYNIQENSRMWPTYNVFLVQADLQVYKVQVTGYYDATGNSGHPTLRYQRLR